MPILFHATRRGFLQTSAATCAWPLVARSTGLAPLRVIVPFAPGGPSDVVLRAIAARWSERSAQTLIIEHKPGAAGSLGAEAVRRAEPDGQTLLFAPADVLVNNTATFRDLPYDPLRDFKPLALIGPVPLVLVVPSGIGARTLADFRTWAKVAASATALGAKAAMPTCSPNRCSCASCIWTRCTRRIVGSRRCCRT